MRNPVINISNLIDICTRHDMAEILATWRKTPINQLIFALKLVHVGVPDESKVMTYFLRPLILNKILKSMAEMDDYVQQSCSDIDYTIVRPPGLTNGQSSG